MKLAIGITDDPGAAYGLGLQAYLNLCPGVETYAVVPECSRQRIVTEMHWTPDMADAVTRGGRRRLDKMSTPAANEVDGVILAPCSTEMFAAIALEDSEDWLLEAVKSCLKQRRPVVALVTQSHLGSAQLELMLHASRMGVTILSCSDAHLAPWTFGVMWCEAIAQTLDLVGVGRPLATWGAA